MKGWLKYHAQFFESVIVVAPPCLVDRWRLLNLEILSPASVNNARPSTYAENLAVFRVQPTEAYTAYMMFEPFSASFSPKRGKYGKFGYTTNIYSYRVSDRTNRKVHISLYVTYNLLFGQKYMYVLFFSMIHGS